MHEVLKSVLLVILLQRIIFLVLPRTSRFASFPEYLVVQIKKFTFGLDWIPKKLGMCFLDLHFSHSAKGNLEDYAVHTSVCNENLD